MKIVIIEDEELTAEGLSEIILKIVPEAQISAQLPSVKSGISWFQKNEHPDLIFSDIQLGDGLSFEIFKMVSTNAPVIFCTAYDEYALKAFDANGIDYILKPLDKPTVEAAFQKYNKLKSKFSENLGHLDRIIQLFNDKRQVKGSILVYFKDRILPVKFEDIALVYIVNEITHILTFGQKYFTVNKTIEEIEKIAPHYFFRVNRQTIVHRKAIKEASQYFARKLALKLSFPFEETISVSKLRVPDFLEWLSDH